MARKPILIAREILDDLYTAQRMTVPMIARKLGLSAETVRTRLKEVALLKPYVPHNLRDIPLDQMIELYVNQGKTIAECAKHFKMSKAGMRMQLKRADLLRPEVQVNKKPYKRFSLTKEQLEDMIVNQRMSDMAIGRLIDVHNITVKNWRERWGIKRVGRSTDVDMDAEKIHKLYVEDGLTMGKVALELGVDETTLRSRIIKLGYNLDSAEIARRRIDRNKKKYTHRFLCRGYRLLKVEGHANANAEGYVREHRYVAECAMGRLLVDGEIVHHINLIKLDNREENLAVLASKKEHLLLHRHMEHCYVYACGWTDKKPELFKFSKLTFWGGKWITDLDMPEELKRDEHH